MFWPYTVHMCYPIFYFFVKYDLNIQYICTYFVVIICFLPFQQITRDQKTCIRKKPRRHQHISIWGMDDCRLLPPWKCALACELPTFYYATSRQKDQSRESGKNRLGNLVRQAKKSCRLLYENTGGRFYCCSCTIKTYNHTRNLL